MNRLRKQLIELGERANEITHYTLNSGGCCVFASLVADRLAELGVTCRGVVATRVGFSVTKQRPKDDPYHITNWNDNGLDFNHVGLKIKLGKESMYYDSEGFYPVKGRYGWGPELNGLPVIPGYLKRDEMQALAKDSNWNSWFNRKHIPALKKLVNEILTGE